jgi:hypothetical protein
MCIDHKMSYKKTIWLPFLEKIAFLGKDRVFQFWIGGGRKESDHPLLHDVQLM